jgi:hypothetical protein
MMEGTTRLESNDLHRQVGQIEGRIEANEKCVQSLSESVVRLEELIERVRDRVPPWIVWSMTAMAGLLGSLLTIIVTQKH